MGLVSLEVIKIIYKLIQLLKNYFNKPSLGTGLVKQPVDKRDLQIEVGSKVKDEVDLRSSSTPVRNQLYESCVGHSVGDLVLSHIRQLTDHSDFYEFRQGISYSYLWYNMRLLEGKEKVNQGVYLRDGFKAVKKYGWCLESQHKNSSHFLVKPHSLAYNRGFLSVGFIDMFFKNYYKVPSFKVKNVLSQGHRVVFGMLIGNEFRNLRGKDCKIETSDTKLGGHAMLLEGYKEFDGKCYFLVKNSWGTNWGDQGYFWLSETLFNRLWTKGGGFDLWTIK